MPPPCADHHMRALSREPPPRPKGCAAQGDESDVGSPRASAQGVQIAGELACRLTPTHSTLKKNAGSMGSRADAELRLPATVRIASKSLPPKDHRQGLRLDRKSLGQS